MIAYLAVTLMLSAGEDVNLDDKLAAIDPALTQPFHDATDALRDKRYGDAAKGFEVVAKGAPGFEYAHRGLCVSLLELKRYDAARPACARALELTDSFNNHLMQAKLALGSNDWGDKRATQEWLSKALHDTEVGSPNWVQAKTAKCMLDDRDGNVGDVCFEQLLAGAPDDVDANYFGTVSAARAGNWDVANARLEKARPNLGPGEYEKLKAELDDAQPMTAKYGGPLVKALLAWAAALLLLVVLGLTLSSITSRTARNLSTIRDPKATGGAHALRSLYRLIVGAGSIFYYVSLPVVLLAVIAVGGGVLYACLAIGRIPIKLVLIAAVMVLVTIVSVLKSLFVRAPDEDPGEKLDWSKAPKLRELLDQIAKTIGTRPVDNVYLTPGTELAVTERGGLRRKWAGTSERALILGIGVLEGMKIGPFSSVLGHEHGHFSNQDTAGGDLALWARRSMLKMGIALAQGGAAAWYNPAWLFFRAYFAIFLRISQGASRLQEVLADRRAIFAYGSAAFRDGYTHVIRRSVAFDAHASATLKEVIEQKKALANLYAFAPAAPPDAAKLEQATSAHLQEESDVYDSHPSGKDRLAWAEALAIEVPADPQAEEEAWSLFDSREALEKELTKVVRNNIAENHQVVIAESEPPTNAGFEAYHQ
jgi:Zn-dependent protease with chaperone function